MTDGYNRARKLDQFMHKSTIHCRHQGRRVGPPVVFCFVLVFCSVRGVYLETDRSHHVDHMRINLDAKSVVIILFVDPEKAFSMLYGETLCTQQIKQCW